MRRRHAVVASTSGESPSRRQPRRADGTRVAVPDPLRARCARLEAVDVVVDRLLQLAAARVERERVRPSAVDAVDAHALARQLVALDRRRRRQGGDGQRRDDQRQEGVQAEGQHAGDHDRQGDRQDEQWTQEAVSVDFRDGFSSPR